MAEKKVAAKKTTTESVGPNEKAIRSHLKTLEVSVTNDARGRLAVTLAKALDNDAGMATAAVSRELRATLAELEGRNSGNDDELSTFLAELSAPVLNSENGSSYVGRETRAD